MYGIFCKLARPFTGALLFSFLALKLAAGDFSARIVDRACPNAIGESIRAVLQPKAIELSDKDKPVLDIWLRQDVPLKADAPKLESIPETTVVGAIQVNESGLKDYKDNDVPKGIYTARFGLQPQDGDHLGTADFSTFFILIAADADKELNGIEKFKPMVKASGKLTGSGHPLILNLRPVSDAKAEAPAVTDPAPEHKAVRLKIPAKTAAGQKLEIACEFTFQGHGHIQ